MAFARIIFAALLLSQGGLSGHAEPDVVPGPDKLAQRDEAIARAEIESGQESADAYYRLGDSLERQGRLFEAKSSYDLALAADAAHVPSLVNLGRMYAQGSALKQATSRFERALEIEPTMVSLRLELARLLSRDGLTVEAEDVLRKGLNQTPEDLPLRLALADSQLAVRYVPGARLTLETGLQWHADDPRLRLRLGQVCFRERDWSAGEAHLKAALELSQNPPGDIDVTDRQKLRVEAAFALAMIARREHDLPVFKQRLQKTLTVDPQHRQAHLLLAGLALDEADRDEAVPHLTVLLKLPPDQLLAEDEILRALPFPLGVHALALAYVEADQRNQAEELLTRQAHDAFEHGKPEWGNALNATKENL